MWRYNEYAQVHPIGERLWAIDEIGKTILYLYEGDERVLLVDTGFGLLDLKKLAEELCPGKELLVVNTHAHGDHNSGNGQFDRVFCGRMDEPSSHQPMDEATRKRFAKSFFTDNPLAAGAVIAAWRPQPAGRTLPLADGDVIDLGGTRLTVLETPGHTIGSICLWDRDAGLLFTGDLALTWEVWGQLECSSALKYYAQSLRRLAGLNAGRVCPAHGRPDNPYGVPIYELPPNALNVYARGTEAIVEGKSVGEPYDCFIRGGLCAYFEIGGMVYDPQRLGNEQP